MTHGVTESAVSVEGGKRWGREVVAGGGYHRLEGYGLYEDR